MAKEFQSGINMVGNRITGLPVPLAGDEPARLTDLNQAIEGLAWKDNVRVASTANINLSAPGASINGVSMNTNDTFLAKDQTTGSQNGIYVWNGASTPATRAPNANTFDELKNAVVIVDEGTSAGSGFRQSVVTGTLDTTSLVWGSFGAATPAATESVAGSSRLATQSETDTGTLDNAVITPFKLANWGGRRRLATATIGDGSATSFNVDHNFNTRNVSVTVFKNSGNYDEVSVDVLRPTVNRVQIVFGSAPASSSYNVVVLG